MIPSLETDERQGVALKLKRVWSRLSAALVMILVLAACGAPIPGESWANLSTDGKYVYVAYKEQIFRIDTSTALNGSTSRPVEWLKRIPNNPHFYAAPAVSDDGAVYVGSYTDKKLYALNSANGNLLPGWTPPTFTDKVVGGAVIAGDMVYVGMGDKGLRAYNRKTGQELHYDDTKYGIWSTPVVEGDTVYFTSLDHNLYALDAKTLAYKWQVDLGGSTGGSPLYDGGTLYAGTFNAEVVAVQYNPDARCVDNTQKPPCVTRRFKADNWVWATPVLNEGVLYFGDLSGKVWAIDAQTFAVKWSQIEPEGSDKSIRGKVAIAKGITPAGASEPTTLVVVGSENKKVYAYDARNGARVWVSALVMNDKVLSDMVIVGNTVVFTTLADNQIVVALNLITGNIEWQINLSNEQQRFQPTAQP